MVIGATVVDEWKVPFNEPVNGTFYINEHTSKTVDLKCFSFLVVFL
jgi:hypothetical protein